MAGQALLSLAVPFRAHFFLEAHAGGLKPELSAAPGSWIHRWTPNLS